jgi:protocatechuate 3,4-dioxygenase beta subunit
MQNDDTPELSDPSRREVLRRGLVGLGALGALGVLATKTPALDFQPQQNQEPLPEDLFEDLDSLFASSCTLTPANVPGPYWLNLALQRQDISEGFAGYPLTVFLKIVNLAGCGPIAGAVADLWHDSPDGHYSGFQSEGTANQTQFRGIQVTGNNGVVRFDTVYPGWYPGRTPHIHLKINPNAGSELTTQLFFDDLISDRVFTSVAPYNLRGSSPTSNATDHFYAPQLQMAFRVRGGQLLAGKRIVIS